MPEISFHDLQTLSEDQRRNLLKRAEVDLSGFIEKVRPIIQAVKDEGGARYELRVQRSPQSA